MLIGKAVLLINKDKKIVYLFFIITFTYIIFQGKRKLNIIINKFI